MTELPQCLSALSPRSVADLAAAALATQANVVTLRVAFERKTDSAAPLDDIRTPAPGPVVRMREILIDLEIVRSYSANEALLRLRQVWGEYCALCWLFPFVDPQKPIDFRSLSPTQTVRCCGDSAVKLDDVQRHLWRIRLEMKSRQDAEARHDPAFRSQYEDASMMPLMVLGQDVRFCAGEVLLQAACEYAGMLAALRWASDDRWAWEGPGIMDIALAL